MFNVDWSKLPVPQDDGAAKHLLNLTLPAISLASTDGTQITLSSLPGKSVVYIYPRTGKPGQENPPGWDDIPGARGCTPQSCSFRDHAEELRSLGIDHIFGLSTQDTEYQKEVATRIHLPFPILSDDELELTNKVKLPVFDVEGVGTLLKRMVLIVDGGRIVKVFYPVFPPEGSAKEVVDYLKNQS